MRPDWSNTLNNNNEMSDHDTLIKNTVMTEQILQALREVTQQLGRGNERFQRIDADLVAIKQRLDGHDKRFEKEIPDALASLRGDMLRAFGSAIEESKKGIELALAPIKQEMQPITEVVSKTHKMVQSIVKWFFIGIGSIIVAVATAYALHLFSF